jgi:endonuclease/exonuclease/phosphatase family metal-dependent hydrolase
MPVLGVEGDLVNSAAERDTDMLLARLQSRLPFSSPRTTVQQLMAVPRIATFNVLYGHLFGASTWLERRLLLRRSIEQARPDVLGLQENLPSKLADVANLVAPLTLVPGPSTDPTRWFAVGASSERNQGGEHLSIAYRADRFELRDSGGFWISATPDRRGSRLPLARALFLVHWARLEPRDLSGSLLVMNSHFERTPWHHAPTAQVVTAQLGALEAASLGSDGLVDARRCTAEPSGLHVTCHCGRGATRRGPTLDYVVARTPSRPAHAGAIGVHNGGLHPSHHHLLVLEFAQDRRQACCERHRGKKGH